MKVVVSSSEINGEIKSPSSKSVMQRVIALALLSNNITTITNPCFSKDSISALKIAESLGAEIKTDKNKVEIRGGLQLKNNELNCGESGLSFRMFSVIASIFDKPITLTGTGSLIKRPVFMIEKPLRDLGVECTTNYGLLPITVNGPLKSGKTIVDGSISSQFISGLLITLPVLKGDSEIIVNNAKSKPYIDLTLDIINKFGAHIENDNYISFKIKGEQKYHTNNFNIEGDWSNAAFLLVAGALGGKIKVTGLDINSKQADKKILEILQKTGAELNINDNFIEVKRRNLLPFEFDAADCPDLFPPIVALASSCEGLTVIKGVRRLIYKESNRAIALKEEFSKLGTNIQIQDDIITIKGGKLNTAEINPHNDHRIAMAAAIAGILTQGSIIIENPQCVEKSYPDFFDDLQLIGMKINKI